jgi:hypothetical protein
MRDEGSPRIIEVSSKDAVIVFRDDDSTDIVIPPDCEYFSEPDPSWKAMLVSILFREDDDEIIAIRKRLEDIIDELGMAEPGTIH